MTKDNAMPPLPIAITMGDPAGIGPEIIVKAAARLAPRLAAGDLRLLVIGSRAALDAASDAQGEPRLPVIRDGDATPALAQVPVGNEMQEIPLGAVSAAGGEFAYLAVERGVQLAQAGRIGAIVTAPLNKEALNLAGHHFAGDTHRQPGFGDDAGARSDAGEPCDHAYRAARRAEETDA
jgi:4-hydroxythreonine-4-phosphate dehydrogenase